MPVVPTDNTLAADTEASESILDLISRALENRPELLESDVDLDNRQISRKAARNALLPSLSLVGFYGGSGLGGEKNPVFPGQPADLPHDLPGTWRTTFNNSFPDYFIGLNLNIPFRNRVAKADQYRSELEYRQASLRKEQLKKQIRIEVRNAQYALEQSRARVQAASKARNLAQRTFDITKKEQDLGAGSNYQTMTAQRDLSIAELDLVTAMTTYAKSKVELDRATGATLEHNGVLIQDAVSGKVSTSSP
jgi:outer membrane protein TolC